MQSWIITVYVAVCVCCHNAVPTLAQFVRAHGQMCYTETQCVDYRMTCAKADPNAVYKSCVCDQYHKWDDTLGECMQAMDIKTLLDSQQEKTDNAAKIQKEADEIFAGAIAAGLLVIILGIVFAIGCAVYGCCECECLFGEVSESKKSEKLDRERYRPLQKDAENPEPVQQPLPVPGQSSGQSPGQLTGQSTGQSPGHGQSPGWNEVVSAVPVQAAVLT